MILLTQEATNATNGMLGVALDSLVVRCETIVWGGTTATGQTYPAVGGLLVSTAAALGAIFAICVAARQAFRMMAEGKGINVMAILRPIFFAFVLAYWQPICSSLYHLVKPVENRFKSVYVWNQKRVDSLQLRRDTLALVLRNEVDAVKAEVIVSEIRTRYGITDEEQEEAMEETPIDGDLISLNAQYSYKDVEFGDILYDELSTTTDENGEEQPEVNVEELMEKASMFSWMEDVIRWIAETIWSISLYFIFIVKYLFLYVLIMFGPVYIICSILDIWKDKWADWIGKYVIVGLYGASAYLILIFGLMIIETTLNADIHTFEKALLNEQNFISYLQMASRLTGLSSVAMYCIALLVTSVAMGMVFELAGYAFPGTVGKSAAEFFEGMQGYVNRRIDNAQELLKAAVAMLVTGGTAAAAIETEKAIEELLADDEEDDMPVPPPEPDSPDKGSDDSSDESTVRGRSSSSASSKDSDTKSGKSRSSSYRHTEEWIQDADEEERKQAEHYDTLRALGGLDSPQAKLYDMAEEAYKWADREAFVSTIGPTYRYSREDLAARMRDDLALEKAEKRGIRKEFEELREARLRENKFLLDIVGSRAVTNSSLTRQQRKLIKKFGLTRAMQLDEKLRHKMLHGLPRLTSSGALLNMDTLTSSREHRQLLKQMGIYTLAMRAEFLRRLANSMVRPNAVYKEKIFFFLTYRTRDERFRCAEHRRLYRKCIDSLEETEALIALKARQMLAERDINVDARGKAVRIPGVPLYWRENADLSTYMQVRHTRRMSPAEDDQLRWFVNRYDCFEKARKLLMQLEVFEAKKRVDDADDFVLERQLKAIDTYEREMWRQMDRDGAFFHLTKRRIESLIRYYTTNNQNE